MGSGSGHLAGLVELGLVFALAIGFGIHQLLDLRRERLKREAAEREAAERAAVEGGIAPDLDRAIKRRSGA